MYRRDGLLGPTHPASRSARPAPAVSLLALLSLVLTVLAFAPTAAGQVDAADQADDQAQPVDVTGLEMVPERTWGVSGLDSDATQTPSLDVLVWDFANIGDRLFVGGGFLNVQRTKHSDPVSQPFLAAFDIDSGDWIETWTPQLDRAVYALDVLPGGSLLVGGEFETVNGESRNGLVALDPTTGEIDPTFEVAVDRPWSTLRAVVRDIEVIGEDVYVGGNFSHLDGTAGTRTRALKAGRFGVDGTLDTGWQPMITGSGVWGLDHDPVRNEVHLVGYFTAVNGEPDSGYFHTVDGVTGATVPGMVDLPRNTPGLQPEMFDVVTGDDLVFVVGEQHAVQVLDPVDQEMLGYYHTGIVDDGFFMTNWFGGGAYQVAERIGDVIIAGCHCTYATRFGYLNLYNSFTDQRTDHRLVMAFDAATGQLIDEFRPDLRSPGDGVWAIGSDHNGCLYIGGDLHLGGLDADAPYWLGGFSKHCPAEVEPDDQLVTKGSTWRYHDGGQDLGTEWRQADYDDGGWPQGPATLGFGDGDEQTTLQSGQLTYYARTEFEWSGPLPASLEVWLLADDGAAVYLNGTELVRDNLPTGPLGVDTPAQGWRGGVDEQFRSFTVAADALVAGRNVLAVEVHNVWFTNPDLEFDLRLSPSDVAVAPAPAKLIELGSTWRHADSAAGAAPATWPVDLPADAAEAAAELGFGDGNEVTVLEPGQETYYFANSFEVTADGLPDLAQLRLQLLADDGAVVYLNGIELLRSNMPDGDINWDTRPLAWVGGADERLVEHTVSGAALVEGTNVVTVEVHNFWPGNPDLSFELELGGLNQL